MDRKSRQNKTDLRRLWSRLPMVQRRLLRTAGALADQLGVAVYLVGGPVRDLLLGGKLVDLDLCVEGDAAAFAHGLARRLRGQVRVHPRFRTATVLLAGGRRIDVATARTEIYPAPAALPIVKPAGIEADLARRDFSVNAMALLVTGRGFGVPLDPFAGLADLKCGLIRVLHQRSFTDDPTRIFRAVRFEQRLGFKIEPATQKLLVQAVRRRLPQQLSAPRRFAEFQKQLSEVRPWSGLRRLAQFGVLGAIHPKLAHRQVPSELIRRVDSALAWAKAKLTDLEHPSDRLRLLTVFDSLSATDLRILYAQGVLTHEVRELLFLDKTHGPALVKQLGLRNRRPPSYWAGFMRPYPEVWLLYLSAGTESAPVRRRLREYLLHWRHVRPKLTGTDLIRLGIPVGPGIAQVLGKVTDAYLDGFISNRREEERWIRRRSPG
jgi:tRNA nucleotidyltransferase (CCA-adding enzyme)